MLYPHIFVIDDVDDDFSAMAAASEFMMSGSGEDAGSSRAQTPQPPQRPAVSAQAQPRRRPRREKRKRGGRNSGNESASSVEKVRTCFFVTCFHRFAKVFPEFTCAFRFSLLKVLNDQHFHWFSRQNTNTLGKSKWVWKRT